jgi:hypothetical protein
MINQKVDPKGFKQASMQLEYMLFNSSYKNHFLIKPFGSLKNER